jgi:hypothetical protein
MKKPQKYTLQLLSCLCIFAIAFAPYERPAALAQQSIYQDSLAASWSNWTWIPSGNYSLSATAPVYSGSRSIHVAYSAGWQGLYLAHPGISTNGYTALRFYLHGGSSGGQKISLYVKDTNDNAGPLVSLPAPQANRWSEVRIPLTSLNASGTTIKGLVWQDSSGGAQPSFYIDEIALVDNSNTNSPQASDGYLHPRAAQANGTTQVVVRVKVSDPQGLGDIAAVTVDGSAVGRGTINLQDHGFTNDGVSGDGIYGAVFTIASGTEPREVSLVATVTDRAGNQASLPLGVLTVLGSPGGSIPTGLPGLLGWGSNAWISDPPGGPSDQWQVKSGVPWSYLYQYITNGWENWGPTFVQRFVNHAWNNNYIPIVTVYILYDLPPACGEGGGCYTTKLQYASAVSSYLASLERAALQAKGSKPVIFNLEPDFYGFMQQHAIQNNQPDDPTKIPVALNKSGYPNTLAGFGRYMVDLIHTTAPNALVAPMASTWAANGDPQNVSAQQAIQMAQRTANFINAMGGAQADLLIVEWSDRDAGSGQRPWWDDKDQNLPRPTRALLWENALSRAAGKRLLLWQVPAGNMNMNNTPQRYRDNRAAYAFSHPRDLFETGIIGLVFGAGDGNQTQLWTDGGFIAAQGKIAYDKPAAPVGLGLASKGPGIMIVRWNENKEPDIMGYRVIYRPTGVGTATTIEAGRRNSVEIPMNQPGSWTAQVIAYDAMGNQSAASAPVTFTRIGNPQLMYLPVLTQ